MPRIIQEAFVSPGCTRALIITTGLWAAAVELRKSVIVRRSQALPARDWQKELFNARFVVRECMLYRTASMVLYR